MRVVVSEKCGEALFSSARHKALWGGRAGGKSWSVATYLTARAASQRLRVVCARQFQNSIKDSSKELIESRIHSLGLSQEYAITDRSITHRITGSSFGFIGLERNIESVRSLEGADIVWVEEARTVSARSMEVLLPTVRKQGSEIIWCWNPEQSSDPVDHYFRGGPPRSDAIVTCVNYTDNPFFDDTSLRQEMEVMRQHNYDRYRHVWLGEYDISYESKVFPNVRIDRLEVPSNSVPHYGLDFGFGSDPSFVVKVHRLPPKTIYIAAEASGRVPLDLLPGLVRSVIRDDADLVWADSSQPGTIEFLNARGHAIRPAPKGPGSVKSGILFLQGHDIVIDPSCEQMREEARLYSWPTDRLTGQVISGANPIDAHNHGWDSVRYSLSHAMMEPDHLEDDSGALVVPLWGPPRASEPPPPRKPLYPSQVLPSERQLALPEPDDGDVLVAGGPRKLGFHERAKRDLFGPFG